MIFQKQILTQNPILNNMISNLTTWHGTDSSKAESLFVYGCLTRYVPKNKSFEIIYRHPYIRGNWDSCWKTEEDIDAFLQESWFKKESFLSYVGMEENEWLQSLFIQKVHDLISWESSLNFFGEPYDEGITTKNVCKKVRVAYNESYELS